MKTPHDHISEELLARYFNNTATQEELDHIRAWTDRSPDHIREMEAFKIIWEASETMGKKKRFDDDAAWAKVRQKMKAGNENTEREPLPFSAPERKIKAFPTKKTPSFTLWAAAVITAGLIAFGWMLFRQETKPELLSMITGNNVSEIKLPDGTMVFLNYNSEISYPRSFTGDQRNVSLKGEAFFDVTPDAAHPFVIQANGTEIKVLGTSFNVKAYSKDQVRVDVSTGKVLVSNAKSEINLVKGQSVEVIQDSMRSILPDANLMGYKTQIFDFHATSMNDVVSTNRNGYHADVRLAGNQLSKCRLTIRFEKEPLDVTLSVIAETMELKLRQEGKTYWLEGPGCP